MGGVAPLTAPTQAANDVAGRGSGLRSRQTLTLARDLLDAPPTVRLAAIRDVADREWLVLLLDVQRETGTVRAVA
jgi:hypothetical protein